MRMTATRRLSSPQGALPVPFGPTRVHGVGGLLLTRYDEVVVDIGNKTKCVDDTLLWADTIEESYFQAIQWLDICGRNGIILNPEKFVFAAPTVDFAGFTVTMSDVRPCSRYLPATAQRHQRQVLVRTGQPGGLRLQYG